MKKAIAITAMASIIGLTGFYQASAYKGMGHGDMGDRGGCNGQAMMMHYKTSQMDEATKEKFDAFFKDTQQIRKSIVVKRAEKRALMMSETPDSKKVGALAGELFDLRMSMHAKAEAAGLPDAMGMDRDCGQNDGRGSHHGRKGMMKGKGMNQGQGPAAN
jgi:Spy/CpxP family protein refolding chaperone